MAPLNHPKHARRRISAPHSRFASALGLAAVCALAAVDLAAGAPATSAASTQEASSVADALGITGTDGPTVEDRELLGQLTASRAQRDAEQDAAAVAQAETEQAAVKAKAEAKAKAAAAAKAKAKAAAAAKAKAKAAAAAKEKAKAAEEAARAEAETSASAGTAAAAAAPAGPVTTAVAQISNSAGPVTGRAQAAANAVVSNVPGAAGITIGGTRASAADPGGHPSGRALDYMVGSNAGLGDAIVAYHVANWDALGVDYIIWQQRMLSSPGGSWSYMEDRGSPTANHMDHPHVNYR